MAFLKVFFLLVFISINILLFSQFSNEIKDAIVKSYHEEKLGLFEKANETMLSVYSEKNYEINMRLAWLNFKLKKYSTSLNYYKKAALLKPKSIEAYWGMVQPLLEMENYSGLNNCYLKILKIDPKNTTANYRVGLYYYYNKKYSTAKKYFYNVISLYPSDFDALNMLAWTHYFLGNFEVSKAYFNKALIIQPYNESIINGLKLIK